MLCVVFMCCCVVLHVANFVVFSFDTVCNVAEEAKNVQRDLPIGILSSLGISSVLYVGVGMHHHHHITSSSRTYHSSIPKSPSLPSSHSV